jgi:hypothetical protein
MRDYTDIEGWGADLDPTDRPAVPKEHIPPRNIDAHWSVPTPQEETIEVLVSKERPKITPVFGTGVPPRGVSGVMRRLAYGYPDGDLRHWLILLAADRVNVIEGLIDDMAHGHLPNPLKEMGWGAEMRHRPVRGALKVAVAAGAFALVLARLFRPRPKPRSFWRLLGR